MIDFMLFLGFDLSQTDVRTFVLLELLSRLKTSPGESSGLSYPVLQHIYRPITAHLLHYCSTFNYSNIAVHKI